MVPGCRSITKLAESKDQGSIACVTGVSLVTHNTGGQLETMDEDLAWEELCAGVKFRFRDAILLVRNHRGGWIECHSIQPKNDFVMTVKRQTYEAWRDGLHERKHSFLGVPF